MQLANTLKALNDTAAAVQLAIDYEDEEAVNDTAYAIVELLRSLHSNNFDVEDLAQQALEEA
jgi:DNA-directed RNA polymerase specialized sigma24 family protein